MFIHKPLSVYWLFCLCVVVFYGCVPAHTVVVPTYIHIDSFHFQCKSAGNADPASNINTAWVYYNNSLVGVFDLPATFPVIAKDSGRLLITPGVAVDGQNNMEGAYPFYYDDTFTFSAQQGHVINHTPATGYYNSTKFYQLDGLNTGKTGFGKWSGNADIVLNVADSLLYNGGRTAGAFLYTNDSLLDTTQAFAISGAGVSYIEFDYKCNIPFNVGLRASLGTLASSAPFRLASILPSGHWQKFYLYVTDFASHTGGSTYNFYVNAAGPRDGVAGYILLANVRLVTLN